MRMRIPAVLLMIGSTVYAADYFPLAIGNRWTYRDSVTGASFIVEAGATLVVNDHVYNTLTGFTPAQLLVRINEFGNLVYWDSQVEMDLLLSSFEIVPGASFIARQRECPEEEGQVQEKPVVHDGPAGPWTALEIRYVTFACADVGDQLEQYVDNIGMVRRVVETFAGPRTYDLVYARVGSQVIAAGEKGGASLTATVGRDAATWEATLHIEQPDGRVLKLSFPSSQEYDFRLRDSHGAILWTWSADRVFSQVVHERDVNGFTATVTVPFPAATSQGEPVLTLEAWLTSAENGPQFAAATSVANQQVKAVGGRRRR